jgi:hypothetical protein
MLRPVPQSLPQPSTNPKKKVFIFLSSRRATSRDDPRVAGGHAGLAFRDGGGGEGAKVTLDIYT